MIYRECSFREYAPGRDTDYKYIAKRGTVPRLEVTDLLLFFDLLPAERCIAKNLTEIRKTVELEREKIYNIIGRKFG